MARYIRTDGTDVQVRPHKGNRWSLDELQVLVGGSIQMVPEGDWGMGRLLRMVVNEEGKLCGLPLNPVATSIVHVAIAKKLKCTVSHLPLEVGHRLRYLPVIHGDVVVIEKGERM